jgi:hypothetical protein
MEPQVRGRVRCKRYSLVAANAMLVVSRQPVTRATLTSRSDRGPRGAASLGDVILIVAETMLVATTSPMAMCRISCLQLNE